MDAPGSVLKKGLGITEHRRLISSIESIEQFLKDPFPETWRPVLKERFVYLLQRLEDKGFVKRDRSLSVHLFSASLGRETYACNQLESLATKLTGGSLAPLITYLVEGKKMSRKEIGQLRDILDESQDEEEES